MFTLVDALLARGVVPVVTSVPPRDDSATADAWVPRYNLVARGIAQARRIPFIDLHRALLSVPDHGLGSDGVHLDVYAPSGARGCVFTAAGLQRGHNVRNLLTLEALARAWDALEGRPAADADAPRRAGTGLPGDAIPVASLPFVDVRDTRVDGVARIPAYPGCNSTADESGREVLYRLDLAAPATVRAFVVSLGDSDVDIHLLSSPDSGQSCVARHDRLIVRDLAAGTWWLSLDTYRASTGLRPGEYLLAVLAE